MTTRQALLDACAGGTRGRHTYVHMDRVRFACMDYISYYVRDNYIWFFNLNKAVCVCVCVRV
ncbi:hypothetical protein QJS04_geneDACA008994 [Acorus gramineus]|uniref:Uncharacterized protein n=1 Tax=Acorus gramineus TaxID=55184 RepID=A0AAV9AEA4_ACOGR|nr:hypothetical protein QJS04_geneDACA008994 [Acorus gramineus]